MAKRIIFISKDALRKNALNIYGGRYWSTPNIDELARKGTVFTQFYTAGGSTAMAFTAMALGRYLFETDRKLYDGSEKSENGNTIFDKLYEAGFDVNIAWDITYDQFAKTHFKCEGNHTNIHVLNTIIPTSTKHVNGVFDDLSFNDAETQKGLELIEGLFRNLSSKEENVFLWLHLPHVFRGRNSYDSDIDVFDRIIGMARYYFGDDSLFISADHGQMNGHKGKFSYGYDVDNRVMQIPLITPRKGDNAEIDFPVSNTQLSAIFGFEPLIPQKFVYCETAYYAQPARKMAIIHENYKLIYDKMCRKFFMYDLEWDPLEELNLFYPEFLDSDRHAWYSLNQRFFYPRWDQAHKEREILLAEFSRVWKNGKFMEECLQKMKYLTRILYFKIKGSKPKNIINIGK